MAVLRVILFLAYPGLIYLALAVMEPRTAAICMLLVLLVRLAITSPSSLRGYARAFRLPALAIAAAMLASAAWNDPRSLLATPAIVSFALLFTFARSLVRGESIVESLARVQREEALSWDEVRYCRRITSLWCGFFLLNGSLALGLALSGNLEGWVLYTGLVAYLLMGSLFLSEFVYRQWRFRRYVGAPTDLLFQRIFPPRSL